MKGLPVPSAHVQQVPAVPLMISEVTLAELKYGIAKSERRVANTVNLRRFLVDVEELTISPVIDLFAEEKARLAKTGNLIPDFNLLIGTTAVHHGLVMVTNNTRHFDQL